MQQTKEKRPTLDLEKMIRAIDELVNTDYCEDMSFKANIARDGKFEEISQEDARNMANILGQVYLISHAIDCKQCSNRWLTQQEKKV